MALRVWLPLNGTLENKGISDVTVTNNGVTVDNNGKIGKCYNFNGSSYMTVPFDATNLQEHFSIAVWVKFPDATSGNKQIIAFSSNSGWNNVRCTMLYRTASTKALFSIGDGTNYVGYNFDITITPNVWQHLCVTFKDKVLTWYLNGEFQKTYTTSYNPKLNDLSGFGIGGAYNGAEKFTGYLNDVRIYDHCLSAKEVKEISQGLVLHYKLDGWSGGSCDNIALNSQKLDISSAKTNKYISVRSSAQRRLRDDGYYEVYATSSWQGFSLWANQYNFKIGDKITYGFFIYTNGNDRALSFYPMMYNSSGTRDTTTGLPISCDGGSFTTGNAKSFTTINTTTPEYHYVTFEWNQAVQDIINNGGSIELSIQVHGTWNSGDWCCLYAPKVERSATPTPWTPAPEDLGIDTTKIIDSSGYEHDGNIVNATTENINLDGRYQVCTNFLGTTVDTTSNTITGAQYLYTSLPMPAWSALTLAWWGNNIAYGRGGIFETTGTTGNIWEGSDYNTTAIANWDSTFGIYNGSSRVNIFSNFVKDSSWHYHTITFDGANVKYYCDGTLKQTSALTGTLPAITGFKIGLGRAGGVYRQIKQKVSDLRIYVTAISAEDVLDLYHTSANIDNEKRLHSFEFVEDDGNRVDEQGLVHSGLLSSDSDLIKLLYDKKLHIEPYGSVWTYIYHHNRPDLWSFASTNEFANSVKIDDNRWFNATEIVNSFSSEWEFLIIYNFTQGGTVYKERWIQTKNPETAVFGDVDAADIIRVTGDGYKTGTWGGLYKKNGSAYWVMNNGTNGNWWGATGSFSIYQGGIPGYGGTITTTGCNDLYIRIDRFSSTPTHASIGRGSIYIFNDFIEK